MTYPPPLPAPHYPPQPPAGGKPRLRGRIPLRLAIIFGVVGIALIVVGGVFVARKFASVDGFKRVTIGQSGTVELDGTGKWIGYYEASDVSNSIARIPNIRVLVVGPSGQTVTIAPYRGTNSDGKIDRVTYDYNGHKGVAAFQFTATAKGSYRIESQAEEQLPQGADVAVGRDVIDASTVGGVIALVVGVLLFIAAIVLLIVGLVRRSGHKKQLANAGAYGGPPAGYGNPQGGGYPQGGGPQGGYPQSPSPGGYPSNPPGSAQDGPPQQ